MSKDKNKYEHIEAFLNDELCALGGRLVIGGKNDSLLPGEFGLILSKRLFTDKTKNFQHTRSAVAAFLEELADEIIAEAVTSDNETNG